MVVPGREQWCADDAVQRVGGEPEPSGGAAAHVGRDGRVEQQTQFAAVVEIAAALAVPDAHGQGEPFENDGVVDVRRAGAFQPHRDPVGRLGALGYRHHAGADLTSGRDPHGRRRPVLVEGGDAAGERGGGAEQGAGVDVADDQLVEAGDHPQTQARFGVERGQPSEKFLHVRSPPRGPVAAAYSSG